MSGKVISAKINKITPHPNAKKLKICLVHTGTQEIKVVCGAANAFEGMHTILAEVGSTLPNGKKIEKANLRGEESFGMLCSAKELDVADEDGIIDLPPQKYPVGTALSDIARENLSSTPWYQFIEKESFWENVSTKDIVIIRNDASKELNLKEYKLISKTYWDNENYLYRSF